MLLFFWGLLIPVVGWMFFPIAAVLLLSWQIGGALVYVFLYSDRKRIAYLYALLCYFTFMVTMYFAFEEPYYIMGGFFGVLVFAFWNYGLTAYLYEGKHGKVAATPTDSDILDDGDWGE